MNENTKNYYSKNQNNEQEIMLIQTDKNEEDEDIDDENNTSKGKNPLQNIGNNIIFKNKYIWGIKTNLYDFIFLAIYFIIIYIIFITFIFPFFYTQKYFFIYIIIIISITSSLLIGLSNQIFCFLTEPGIVPRNSPSLKIKDYSDKIIYSKISKKPIIRIQRNCAICSIRRPKKCQHCFFCDNCVEEFDHHCKYVSNCIGKRNKKYFIFYIFFYFIFLSQIYIFSFLHFCFSFRLYKDDILEIYNNIYFSIIILGLSLILIIANNFFTFDYNGYLIYCLYLTNSFFIILFYYNKKDYMQKSISPFNIVLLNVLFKWLYYFLFQIIHQMKMIALSMTSSQYRNLISYLKAINSEESFSKLSEDNNSIIENDNNEIIKCAIIKDIPGKKEIPKFHINNLIKNLKNLILKDIPPSLIYQEIKYF